MAHRTFRALLAVTALVAGSTVALVATAPVARALTVIDVATTDDGGPGSLRAAFAAADAADPDAVEIVLQRGVTYLLECDEGALSRTESNALTITGNGSTITQTCEGERVITNVGSAGHLTVQDVTITGGNVGDLTGGGGIGATSAGLTILNSTVAGNSAGSGGAVFVTGGGDVEVINSTIADNVATSDTGGGGIEAQGDATLVYSTLTGNTAGGSNQPANVRTGGDLVSFGSVLAQPLGTSALNCIVTGATTSQGYNFSDDDSCGFDAVGDIQNGGDPGLGPLAPSARFPLYSDCLSGDCGTSLVRIPVAGSPLVDRIPNSACQTGNAAGITGDERGFGQRPSPPGGACDVGAIEEQSRSAGDPPPADPIAVTPALTG